MFDNDKPLSPDLIVTAIVNGLATWAKQHGATPSIASDPYMALELLQADSPGSLRLVVHWVGDDPLGDQMEQAPLVTNALEVSIGLDPGLTARADLALVAGNAQRPALFKLISDLRAEVLSIEFPAESTGSYFAYGGCRPAITPEGVPLSAYTLRFNLDAAITFPAARRPASFRKLKS